MLFPESIFSAYNYRPHPSEESIERCRVAAVDQCVGALVERRSHQHKLGQVEAAHLRAAAAGLKWSGRSVFASVCALQHVIK